MSGEHVPGYYEAPQPLEMPHGRGGGGYRPLSPEERVARDENRRAAMRESVNTHFAALAEELAQGKSDRLERFLTCSANMIRLSAANQELVFSQMPDATFVATYPTWTRDYNRYPEGKATIYIRQPKPFVITERIEAEETDTAPPGAAPARQPGEKVKAGTSFHPLAVWDVSQTKQMEDKPVKPLPVFFTPLAGPDGMGALNDRLQQAMEAEGITVGETIYTEGAEGYNLPNVVMTREGLAPTNKALVRIHEWTHNLLHRTEEARSFPTAVIVKVEP